MGSGVENVDNPLLMEPEGSGGPEGTNLSFPSVSPCLRGAKVLLCSVLIQRFVSPFRPCCAARVCCRASRWLPALRDSGAAVWSAWSVSALGRLRECLPCLRLAARPRPCLSPAALCPTACLQKSSACARRREWES